MNDEPSPESAEEAAKRAEDLAALEQLGALRACEACGGEFTALGMRALLQLVGEGGRIKLGEGGEMVVAMCTNCGLMRMHSATLLFMDEED
jgi:hypothetical protein